MKTPRLGVASVIVSMSDAEGFKVVHGTRGDTLVDIPADKLRPGDWELFWSSIEALKMRAAMRAIGEPVEGDDIEVAPRCAA